MWPEFPEAISLEGDRAWTARYDSWDERNDDVYYLVTIREAKSAPRRFMASISSVGVDALESSALLASVRDQLQRIATNGVANTSYKGNPFTWASEGAVFPAE